MGRREHVLLVDLAGGDQARVLGVDPSGTGLAGWLAHPNPPPDSLARLEVPATKHLSLLPFHGGRRSFGAAGLGIGAEVDVEERLSLLAQLLAADDRPVVVDLGVAHRGRAGSVMSSGPFSAVVAVAERSSLVTRLCYLALTAAMELPVPDDIVVVTEPDRALRLSDVEAALGVPVAALRWDPAVARAVDSGLLANRLPRLLRRIPLADPAAARPVSTGGGR